MPSKYDHRDDSMQERMREVSDALYREVVEREGGDTPAVPGVLIVCFAYELGRMIQRAAFRKGFDPLTLLGHACEDVAAGMAEEIADEAVRRRP